MPPPANSLLKGMTPANYTLPAGWELVKTQDFESGSVSSNEFTFGSITDSIPHTGKRSLQGRVWKDDCATGWKLKQGVATSGELYFSWYEFMEEHGRMNDEMFLMSIRKNWPGDKFQTERWQWLNSLGDWSKAFNILDGNLVFFCEGTQPGTTGSVCYYNKGIWRSVGFGKWQQWEVYWKTNTPGKNDGITQIYLDGVKITEVTNTGFTGTLDMTGPGINLGGPTYTKIDWGSNLTNDCSVDKYHIDKSLSRPSNFANPCRCPNQCPPNGYVPIFHRFVDDIIILQKETATHINDDENNKITETHLYQNSPNPFKQYTQIDFMLKDAGLVTLKIYNISGREILSLVNSTMPAGKHTVQWDGTNSSGAKVGEGVYFYQLKAGDSADSATGWVDTKKMILSK